MLVDIITLAVGTPGLPLGAAKISNSYAMANMEYSITLMLPWHNCFIP